MHHVGAGQGRISHDYGSPTAPSSNSPCFPSFLPCTRRPRRPQASQFLVLANKGALRLDDIIAMCPALNVQQLYRLATTFWDDSPMPPPPPPQPHLSASRHLSADLSRATSGAGAAESTAGVNSSPPASRVETGGGAGKDESAEAGEPIEEGKEEAEEETEQADVHAAAAAAAVAAAEAAAAADEAADGQTVAAAPHYAQQDPAASAAAAVVSRNVSGEVLEEMKRRHAVANNGGLIVTFLLVSQRGRTIYPVTW